MYLCNICLDGLRIYRRPLLFFCKRVRGCLVGCVLKFLQKRIMASDGTNCKEFFIVVDNKTDQIWNTNKVFSQYIYTNSNSTWITMSLILSKNSHIICQIAKCSFEFLSFNEFFGGLAKKTKETYFSVKSSCEVHWIIMFQKNAV